MRLSASDSEGFADILHGEIFLYAGVVSRSDTVGDRVLLPFPPRTVYGRRGVAREACSMIEHRPYCSRQGAADRDQHRQAAKRAAANIEGHPAAAKFGQPGRLSGSVNVRASEMKE